MTATLHVLHSKGQTIGGFLRVGHTGHRKLEALIAASRLRFRRFVFDAAHKRIYVPELDRSFSKNSSMCCLQLGVRERGFGVTIRAAAHMGPRT